MRMDYDMGVLLTDVKDKSVITLDFGVSERGDPVYRISWYNGHRWGVTPRFESFEQTYAIYKLLLRMI